MISGRGREEGRRRYTYPHQMTFPPFELFHSLLEKEQQEVRETASSSIHRTTSQSIISVSSNGATEKGGSSFVVRT